MPTRPDRVTLDLGPDSSRRLARLQERLEASKIGVFKQSLRLLEYLLRLDEEKAKFVVETQDGKQKEIVLFGVAE